MAVGDLCLQPAAAVGYESDARVGVLERHPVTVDIELPTTLWKRVVVEGLPRLEEVRDGGVAVVVPERSDIDSRRVVGVGALVERGVRQRRGGD